MHYISFLSWFLLILLCSNTDAQPTDYMAHLQYSRGKVLPSNDFVAFDNKDRVPLSFYEGIDLKYILQGGGRKNWQLSLNLPYYGFGLGARDFKSDELGKSYSAYGILGIPVFRTKYLSLFSELQYGMAFGWNHYNPESNPYNHAIGSKITVHAGATIQSHIHLNRRLDLQLAGSFLHFSNGRFERPNNGLNIATYTVGLAYHFKNRVATKNIPRPMKEERATTFAITLGYGDHQRTEFIDNYYFAVAGLNLSVAKRHSNLYQSRVGMDINCFWSISANEDGSNGPVGWENLTIGLIYQPEIKISKFTLIGGLGIYGRHAEYGAFKQMYQRLGVRYNFTDWLSLGSNIRSVDFYQAEFLEFQLGFHF